MNFYRKDKKYRKVFRNNGSSKIKTGLFLTIFMVVVALMTVFLPSGDSDEYHDSDPDRTAATVIKENDLFPEEEKDRPINVLISDVVKNKPDKSSYFPDQTPAEGVITDGYGPRTDPEVSFHYAMDIAGDFLSPIYSAADGEVETAGSDDIYGLNVVVNHIYDGYKTKYAHMAAYVVHEGQKVKKGDIIGFMGTTGYSTGVHLHYEVIKDEKKLDPAAFVKIKNGRTVTD